METIADKFDAAGDARRNAKAAVPAWSLFSAFGVASYTVTRDDAEGFTVRLLQAPGKDCGGISASIAYRGPNDRLTVQRIAEKFTPHAEPLPHPAEPFINALPQTVDADTLAETLAFLIDAASVDDNRTQLHRVNFGPTWAASNGIVAHYVAPPVVWPEWQTGGDSAAMMRDAAVFLVRAVKTTRCRKVRAYRMPRHTLWTCAGPSLTVTVEIPLMAGFGTLWTILETEKARAAERRAFLAVDAGALVASMAAWPARGTGSGHFRPAVHIRFDADGGAVAVAADGGAVAVPGLSGVPDPATLGLSIALDREYLKTALSVFFGGVAFSVDGDVFKLSRYSSGALIMTGRTATALDAQVLIMPQRN